MHEISTVDGFVEITESMADMIKFVANEPSAGLFYIQQHTQNAVPHVVTLQKHVGTKSHETMLHTEDLEDSISVMRSMKDCGFSTANEMIKDIRKSLAILSTKQPKKGPLKNQSSSYQMKGMGSWGPASWSRRSGVFSDQVGDKGSYISTVFKTAKEKASNFKWPQLDPDEPMQTCSTSSSFPGMGASELSELHFSGRAADEPDEDEPLDVSSPSPDLFYPSENYDMFKADREAKLEEWLKGGCKGPAPTLSSG